MVLKITSPLFAASASGSIGGVGTFREVNGVSYLITNAKGNPTSVPGTAALRACFATAKGLHSAIVPTWSYVAGRYRLLRSPSWPAYWTQYLIDNPACLL